MIKAAAFATLVLAAAQVDARARDLGIPFEGRRARLTRSPTFAGSRSAR